jgi:hypothetical protein
MKTFKQIDDGSYIAESGETFRRERVETPLGNAVDGKWVYRNEAGAVVDSDWYRYDLAERHDIRLQSRERPQMEPEMELPRGDDE